MSAPRLYRKHAITAEVSEGDSHGVTIELAVSQSEGVSLSLKHFGDIADRLTAPSHTVFGLLATPHAADPTREAYHEAFAEPALFLEFVAALNALAAQLPAIIAATQYTHST